MSPEAGPKAIIQQREALFVDKTMLAHRTWRQANKYLEIPLFPKGMVIVDVGGGASEVTAALAVQGAKAYAIDPRYAMHPHKIVEMAKRNFVSGVDKEEALKSMVRFEEDFRKHRDRYKVGTASSLPFADDSVDFLFSSYCITFFLDHDWDLFKAAIDEALRVVKRGGEIQITPFMSIEMEAEITASFGLQVPEINVTRRANNLRLLDYLTTISGVEHEVVTKQMSSGRTYPLRLTIRKV